ncbi:P116 family lipid acquisition surface protein [Mycoplasmoides gallisepticum]|uniref:P116 family lipid acquisition surface protein n=1 Tax=Mycoplasmoides gallisepticum TaxID=2096 RepID=UPI00334F0E3A
MKKKTKLLVTFGLSLSLIGTVAAGTGITLYKKQQETEKELIRRQSDIHKASGSQPGKPIGQGVLDDEIAHQAEYKAQESNDSGLALINKPNLQNNPNLFVASHSIQRQLDALAARKVNDSNNQIIESDISSYLISLYDRNNKMFSFIKERLNIRSYNSADFLSLSIDTAYLIKNEAEQPKDLWINNRKLSINSKTTLELSIYTDRNPAFFKKAKAFLTNDHKLNWSVDKIYFNLKSLDGAYSESWSLDNFVFNQTDSALNAKISHVKNGYSEYDAINNFVGTNKLLNNRLDQTVLKDSLRRNFEDKFNLAKKYAGYIYQFSKWVINHRTQTFNLTNFIQDNAQILTEIIIYGLQEGLKTNDVNQLKPLVLDLLTSYSANKQSKTLYRIIIEYKDQIIKFLTQNNLVNISAYQNLIDNFFNSIDQKDPIKAETEFRDKIVEFVPTIKELVKEDSSFYPYIELLVKILSTPKPYFIDSIIKDPTVFQAILDIAYDRLVSAFDQPLKDLLINSKNAIYALLMDNNKRSFNELLIRFFIDDFRSIFELLKTFNITFDFNNPTTKFFFDTFILNNNLVKGLIGLESIVGVVSDLLELISPQSLAKITLTPLKTNQTNNIQLISTANELKVANLDYGYLLNLNHISIKNSTVKKILNLIPPYLNVQTILNQFITDKGLNKAADQAVEEAKKISGAGIAIYGVNNFKNEVLRNLRTFLAQIANVNVKQLITEMIYGNLTFNDKDDFINLNGSIKISIKGNNIQVLPYYTQVNQQTIFDYQLLGITKEIDLSHLVNNSKLLTETFTNPRPLIPYQDLSKKLFAITRSFYQSLKGTLNNQPIRIIDNLVLKFGQKIILDQNNERNRVVKNAYDPNLLIVDLSTKKGLNITKEDATKNWIVSDTNNIIIDSKVLNQFNNLIKPIGIANRYLTQAIRPFSTGELKGSLAINFDLMVIFIKINIPITVNLSMEQRILGYDLLVPYNVANDADPNNVKFINKVSKHWEDTIFNFGT